MMDKWHIFIGFNLMICLTLFGRTNEAEFQKSYHDFWVQLQKFSRTVFALYLEHVEFSVRLVLILFKELVIGVTVYLQYLGKITGLLWIAQYLDAVYILLLFGFVHVQVYKGICFLLRKWNIIQCADDLLQDFENAEEDNVVNINEDAVNIEEDAANIEEDAVNIEVDTLHTANSEDPRLIIVDSELSLLNLANQEPPVSGTDLIRLVFDSDVRVGPTLFHPDTDPPVPARVFRRDLHCSNSLIALLEPALLEPALLEPASQRSATQWSASQCSASQRKPSHRSPSQRLMSQATSQRSTSNVQSYASVVREWSPTEQQAAATRQSASEPDWYHRHHQEPAWCPRATESESMILATCVQKLLPNTEVMHLVMKPPMPGQYDPVPMWTTVRNRYTLPTKRRRHNHRH